ncbi:hypothetical protein M885DRAFT_617256 [Pelagophyceae sp. CCMP2097]|nr:hypothetical protein M885DRAFT_617256 [Pelagophyceae sp. CCMP2097]
MTPPRAFVVLMGLVGASASSASLAEGSEDRHKRLQHGAEVAAWVRQSHSHEPAAPAAGGDRLKIAGAVVDAALKAAMAYYGGDAPILDAALVHRTTGLSQALDGKLARLVAGKGSGKFTVGVLGSSVTAGHDGFGNTAYPAVLERALKPVFAALGVNVEVRNLAVGGREPFPASMCVRTICGDDADLIVREWEYWDFADGLISDGAGGAAGAVEVFARNAWAIAQRPAVFFLQMDTDGFGDKSKRLREMLLPEGALGKRYAETEGAAVFSAFGTAFDHLRAAAPAKRTKRGGGGACGGKHVGDCPLSPPDGHHVRAEFEGVDIEAEPEMLPFVRPGKLFVNWHPGALGHEVMGKQLAYHVLLALRRGLDAAAASGLGDGARPPLGPATSACKGPTCATTSFCAMATLPKAPRGPDLGDVVDNSTAQTMWRSQPAGRSRCPRGATRFCGPVDPAAAAARSGARRRSAQECYETKKHCSYYDQKRGFVGGEAAGTLDVVVPFAAGASVVYVSEATHEWSKPLLSANWHMELSVSVDGEPCRACQVAQAPGNYVQNLRVDVLQHRALSGALPKKENEVRLSFFVTPVASLPDYEAGGKPVCKLAPNQRCEPADEWRRYAIDCTRMGNRCAIKAPVPLRARDSVKTSISSILVY